MKQKKRILSGWIIFLLLTGLSGCSTSLEIHYAGEEQAVQLESSGLIDQDTAIFFPEGFIPEETLPSFALMQEPVISRDLPENWELLPEYYTRDGVQGVRFPLPSGTSVYGTGEVTGPLLRNGSNVSLWNTDNFAYSKFGGKQLYQSHPWVLGVRDDGTAFGILADSSWKMSIFLGDSIVFFSEGPSFRTLVIEGKNPEEVLIRLGELTGRMELPPLWAIGYHQCRYSYYPDDQVLEIASTFREKQIPADVIWLDIHYMDEFRVFTFDPIFFRDPSEMNAELHDENFKTIWMIDPGIKVEPGYEIYDEGSAGDHWVQTADAQPYIGDVWPGECVFPDFTRPETREWWSGLYADFMANGIDGVWNDMNEPAVFHVSSGTMPENNLHRGGGELPAGPHLRYHNVYGMLMIQATREGIADYAPDKRPFVLTRANYLGGQRYGATWTGDNASH